MKVKFEEMKIKDELLRAVKELGFEETTEIQGKTIPTILSGKDIVGHSQTGSGKTAAFGLPILSLITPGQGIQAIILTPTRELTVQVSDAIKTFAKYTHAKVASVYGGVSIEPQMEALRKADIVVGTPGRVLDHIGRRTINLTKVRFFVLDEADKMLEMGFIDDVKEILRFVPKTKQSLLWSATMPTQIKNIIREHFKNPVMIQGQTKVDTSLLKQIYFNIKPEQKFSLLVYLLKKNQGISLIFCATRNEVDMVEKNLNVNGINAKAIHGGMGQGRRLNVVEDLKKENITVLVATDVAARGLDIKNITHVYNYDLPNGAQEYTHRIGRTARAGESGDAVTLLTQKDYGKFQNVLSDRTIRVEKAEMPQIPILRFDRTLRSDNSDGFRPRQGRNFTNRSGGRGSQRPRSGGGGFRGRSDSGDRRESSGGFRGGNSRR